MQQDEEFDQQGKTPYANQLLSKKQINAQKFSHNPSVDIPFNKGDPALNYYRQSQILHENNEYLTKFGWKITQLQREEQDLTLQCCNCLQSQLICSVDFFLNTIKPPEDQHQQTPPAKCLWMETSIHRTGDSNLFNPSDRSSSISKIFQIYEKNLLPKLACFIKKYIKWDQITKNGKDHQQILNAFQEEVIQKMNELIENQMKPNEA